MQDTDIIRELREQARTYTEAANLLAGQVGQPSRTQHATTTPKRHLSKSARARISLAQQERWAVLKGGKSANATNGGKKKAVA